MQEYTFIKSLSYAVAGIKYAIRDNRNLKIHFVVAILVLLASYVLQVTAQDFALLVVMIILVISAEMINTAHEEMVDLITTEHRKEAKAAKDVAAGMVLVTSAGAALVGLIILLPYIIVSLG